MLQKSGGIQVFSVSENNLKIIGELFGGYWKKLYLCSRNSERSNAGPLAQLNRASHYGCEGCGFESRMDHLKRACLNEQALFFCRDCWTVVYIIYNV